MINLFGYFNTRAHKSSYRGSASINGVGANVNPITQNRAALEVSASLFMYVVTASVLTEASSTTTVINATAHSAKIGDRLRFTSGNQSGIVAVVTDTATNTITLGEFLPAAPATNDTFDILRFRPPLIDSTGKVNISGTITATESDVGATGAAVPANAALVGGTDGTNLRALNVSTTGQLHAIIDSGTITTISAQTQNPAGTSTFSRVSVSTTATALVTANAASKLIRIYNPGAASLYLGISSGVTAAGATSFELPAGGAITWDSTVTTSGIWGIYSAITASVSVEVI